MSRSDDKLSEVEQAFSSLGAWYLMVGSLMRVFRQFATLGPDRQDLDGLTLSVVEKRLDKDGGVSGVRHHTWDWDDQCWLVEDALGGDVKEVIKVKFAPQLTYFGLRISGPDMFTDRKTAAKALFEWDSEHRWYREEE